MLKIAIIYSPINLDSCLAAAIEANNFSLRPDSKVQSFPYSRAMTYNDLPKEMDIISILGADISALELDKILDKNPTALIKFLVYTQATIYDSTQLERLENRGVNYSRFAVDSVDLGHMHHPSIALKIFNACDDNEKSALNGQTTLALIGVVNQYCTFKKRTAVQTREDMEETRKDKRSTGMTEDETVLLFSNKRMIKNAARCEIPFAIINTGPHILDDKENPKWVAVWNDYIEYDKEMRRLVEANNRMCYYAGANGSAFTTPTCAVTEQDMMHVTRFINYSHTDVITHEDTRDCRVYRILSEKSLDWYVKRFQPIDVWSEGQLICLKTELPKHMS